MTSWTKRAEFTQVYSEVWGEAWGASWGESWGALGSSTVWTEQVAPATTIFLAGPVRFYVDSNQFYSGSRGRLHGLVPAEKTDDFYVMASDPQPGFQVMGYAQDNFNVSTTR